MRKRRRYQQNPSLGIDELKKFTLKNSGRKRRDSMRKTGVEIKENFENILENKLKKDCRNYDTLEMFKNNFKNSNKTFENISSKKKYSNDSN